MKFLNTCLTLGILGAAATGNAAARLAFTCDMVKQPQTYENIQLKGYLNMQDKSVNLTNTAVDKNGQNLFFGVGVFPLQVNGDLIQFSVTNEDQSVSEVKFSTQILATVQPVTGSLINAKANVNSAMTCQLHAESFGSSLEFLLPAADFDRYNLPLIPQPNPQVLFKQWSSKDGLFTFAVTRYPDSEATKHLPAVPAHTDILVTLVAAIVDNNPEDPTSFGYLLYGPTPKRIEAKIKDAADVKSLMSIFGTAKTTLKLVHSYGHSTNVNVDIDCGSGAMCVISAAN
jgi:hypothetical protein